ncbi:MAG: ABC transporter permease subunit, partial [Nostocoides sp.]
MTQPVAASGPLPLGRGRAATWVWRAGWVAAAALPLIFLGIFFAWPVSSLVARGFSSEAGSGLSAVTEVLSAPRTWRIVRDTLTLATLGTLASVLLGLPAAYLLYVVRFPGRGALRAFVTIPFVLPTVVVGVAFVALLGPRGPLAFLGWQESLPAIVAALVFFNFSVVVRTVGGLWGRLDPRAVQAARALGASPARAFRT